MLRRVAVNGGRARFFRFQPNQEYRAAGLTGKYARERDRVHDFQRFDPINETVYNPQSSREGNNELFSTAGTNFRLQNINTIVDLMTPSGTKSWKLFRLTLVLSIR